MEFLKAVLDFALHLDTELAQIIAQYGAWTYVILFLVIFCETGLVVTPFLPGDSLLFATGALAAVGAINIWVLFPLLIAASICGDSCNYTIGFNFGHKFLVKRDSKIFKRKYIDKTQEYYDKYGAKTMVIARFVPIVRTFAPFMAGVGKMKTRTFAIYIVIGAVLWVSIGLWSGYLFGNVQFVKEHFSIVILAIIGISVIPAIVEIVRHKMAARKSRGAA
ncbi:MAG: DedA family protein [Candidatus Zixiibacteriota bacterium]